MLGGENLVKTTVRPSGVKVDAKTSPVDTMPGANMVAGPAWSGRPGMMLLPPMPDAQALDRSETTAIERNRRRETIAREQFGIVDVRGRRAPPTLPTCALAHKRNACSDFVWPKR